MGLNMVTSLFDAIALLLGLFIVYQVVFFLPSRHHRMLPVLQGLMTSLICIVIMSMPFTLQSGIIFDTRSILISVTALMFSPILTVITVVVAILYRIIIGGVGMVPGIAIIISSALIGMAWRRWLYPKTPGWRWLNIYAMGICVHGAMLLSMFLLPYPENLFVMREIMIPVLGLYPIVTVFLTLILIRQQTLKHMQDQLEQSEERFQLLFDKAPLGYQSLDFDGNFIEVNQKWCDLLGYARDEVLGKWFGDFLSPAYREAFRQRFPLFKTQGYIHSEFEMLHASGERLIISFEGKIGYGGDGAFKQTHCILQDITQQKAAEDALVENEKKYRNIAENMSDVVWQTDLQLKTLYISPSVEKLLGETPEVYVHKPLEEIFSEQSLIKIRSLIADELEKEKDPSGEKNRSHIIEVEQYKADGTGIWISMNITGIRDEQGSMVGFLGVSRDITQHKGTEMELQESERSKSVLLSNLPGMAYRCTYDREWTMQFVSAGCFDLTGYTPESLIDNRDLSFNELITHKYREALWKEWEHNLAMRKPFMHEYEITTASGEQKWVIELGEGVFNDDGTVEALEGIIIDISERKKLEMDLQYANEHDFWTGLYNLSSLVEVLSHEKADKENEKTAIVGIDLSAIHSLGKAYGFRYGQDLIKKVADSLRTHCTFNRRLFHIYENQFAFYIQAYKDKDALMVFCTDIAHTLELVLAVERVDGGIGIVEIQGYGVEQILRNLMVAFENTKTMVSRNFGFCLYDKEMETQVLREHQIEHELLQIAADEADDRLFLQFQPILDLASHKICGFEALARLNSKQYGRVPPLEFIPIAEKTKVIIPLGRQIILQAFRFSNSLREKGYEDIDVSINISAIQLLEKSFAKNLIVMMDAMHIDPAHIELEITESVFASNYQEINEILGELKTSGIKISIDDFGTGYSSLARERELNVDCLKIDRSFIVKLLTLKDEEAITGDVIRMAHRMGHSVIAEGVEEERQLQYLKDHGCDKIQGYLIARPLDSEAAFEMLKNQTKSTTD
ncbi:MAG: EAL domain-containing protein [Sphaerochaeta sp.]|nr:EAL domain-containing protein [Sphaerochaeta sp.]